MECGANLLMHSVGRLATDKFSCRVIRRPFVGVLSNEDAVLRVEGSAKTVPQPILPENKTEPSRAGGDNCRTRRDDEPTRLRWDDVGRSSMFFNGLQGYCWALVDWVHEDEGHPLGGANVPLCRPSH